MHTEQLLEKRVLQLQNKPTGTQVMPGADICVVETYMFCSALSRGLLLTQSVSLPFPALSDASPMALTLSIPVGLTYLLS